MGLSLPKSNLIFLKKCLDKWVHFKLPDLECIGRGAQVDSGDAQILRNLPDHLFAVCRVGDDRHGKDLLQFGRLYIPQKI